VGIEQEETEGQKKSQFVSAFIDSRR
jgi:hypothetical protein